MRLQHSLIRSFEAFRSPVLAFVSALLLGSVLFMVLGERPGVLFEALYNTFFTEFGLGYTLFYATPLIFTGLSVAVCFHCGLFNIGAEGQLYVGAIAIVWLSNLFKFLPWFLAVPFGVFAAAVVAGVWGGIAGILKAKRGSHEVIVTILLNFIGISLVNYFILYGLKNPEQQNPETISIPGAFRLPLISEVTKSFGHELFSTIPLNLTILFAVTAAVAVHLFLFRTVKGYELRAVGLNPVASRFSGISIGGSTMLAMFLGGALSGMVGVNEVMGHHYAVIEGFSPGYGFTGIAVALLARNHPIGIIASAILFGSFHNSSRELEFLSDKISKELSLVLEGSLIAFVACDLLVEKWYRRLKRKEVVK